MEIQPSRSSNPPGQIFVRWGLRGGVLAALAMLMVGVASNVSGLATLAVVGVGAGGGGAVALVAALIFRRRKSALSLVENDLERARAMLERRLISEDEYLEIKRRILSGYEPGQPQPVSLWSSLYWGAVLGVIACGLLAVSGTWDFTKIILFSGATGAVGGVATGAAAQGYALASGMAQRFQLPAPPDRRLLDK